MVGRNNVRLGWPIFRCYIGFREGITPLLGVKKKAVAHLLSPEKGSFQKERLVFQPSFFRGIR